MSKVAHHGTVTPVRVIAGEFRGRRLVAPDTADTRPVTDRVKEAVFSSLADTVDEAEVLDLYAGAGSFGIEALSRGARHATFVENGRRALDALRRNLEAVGAKSRATVIPTSVERFLEATTATFDLVFCDPPWPVDTEALTGTLERLVPHLADRALVVVSRRSSDTIPQPAGLRIDTERRYGDTRIVRYAKEQT